MRIALVTPAPPRSRAGNRATAARWAKILRDLGHRVDVSVAYPGHDCDLMIALHAWRSAEAVRAFRAQFPRKPLVLALTGTDLYHFINTHPQTTLESIGLADRLVGLHDEVARVLPAESRDRLRIIYQSSRSGLKRQNSSRRYFDICVAGHLRHEKDPLRAALAVRNLPADSRVRVLHFGKAHNQEFARAAELEEASNPRYRWFGEVPRWQLNRIYARARLMIISSRMEGGANVVSEAVSAGLPVLASYIDGNVGLLGRNYPGYFPVEDTDALTRLVARAETDAAYLVELTRACSSRANLFAPARERKAWQKLLEELA